jgi:hypothetical protein
MAASVEIAVFCEMTSGSLVDIYRRFGGILLPPSSFSISQAVFPNSGSSSTLKMEATNSSESMVSRRVYHTTRRHLSEE